MKQFWTIFKFELSEFFHNKVFIGITVVLVALSGILMYAPKFFDAITSDDYDEDSAIVETDGTVLIKANWDALSTNELDVTLLEGFESSFPYYTIEKFDGSIEELEAGIKSGDVEFGFVFPSESISLYQYYVNDLSLYDDNTDVADEMLNNILRTSKFVEAGVDANTATMYMNLSVSHDTVKLGQDQSMNFFYTYIMIMALYMVIAMYGQMVATRVAAEKDSRAMELLIASAKPSALMFGKVFASCFAGLFQISVIFGSCILFYNISGSASTGSLLASLFDIPVSLLIYMIIFFLLGYLLYAFLFGAIGSTVSKTEDLSSAITPVTMIFVIAFMIVIFSMSSGTVNSGLMKFCSYFPFTSPMAMFTRIAMSDIPFSSILICIGILVISVYLIGRLSAKIYRVGVLMYGQKPNILQIVKQVIHS